MNTNQNKELVYREECYRIIGACFEVHNEKGCGFTELVYQECLEIELGMQQIPFEPQAHLPLSYKGRPLRQRFQPDFVCMGKNRELRHCPRMTRMTRILEANRIRVHSCDSWAKIRCGHI